MDLVVDLAVAVEVEEVAEEEVVVEEDFKRKTASETSKAQRKPLIK